MTLTSNAMENFNRLLENFIRGPLTTLLGLAVMMASMILWFFEMLSDTQAIVFGVLGFLFVFMKDEIPGFIRSFIKKKTGVENEKKIE